MKIRELRDRHYRRFFAYCDGRCIRACEYTYDYAKSKGWVKQ